MSDDLQPLNPAPEKPKRRSGWIWDVALVLVLLIGAYFRFTGMNWDSVYHLHPDERFLTMVASSISPVDGISSYFDTATSSLNPNNRGYGFYVYGTLPLFIVRMIGDALKQTGYDQINIVGRWTSATFDLMTVLLVYFTAYRLFKKDWLAVLAAAFTSMAVMQIQLSHYFTVDNIANFFLFLAFYLAVIVMTQDTPPPAEETEEERSDLIKRLFTQDWKNFLPYALFGLALGMALASKISAAPIAAVLPLAAFLYYLKLPDGRVRREQFAFIWRNLILAAIVSIIAFRIFQPYAFAGPGLLSARLNPAWTANLSELSSQSYGDVDFPPALQWARRPLTFAWTNMVQWGLGIPLGILAWAGFLFMAWRMIKGEWKKYLLLWGWTGAYFAWQSINFTRSMRYQIAVYPTLAIIAAWLIGQIWGMREEARQFVVKRWRKILAVALAVVVLAMTGAWAFAFTRIYNRPVTRMAASEWIYQNVPGPIDLTINTANGLVQQPVAFRSMDTVSVQKPLVMKIVPRVSGEFSEMDFSYVLDVQNTQNQKTLIVSVSSDPTGNPVTAIGNVVDVFSSAGTDPRGPSIKVTFLQPATVTAGQAYYLRVYPAEDNASLRLAGPMLAVIKTGETSTIQQPLPDPVTPLDSDQPFVTFFTPIKAGSVQQVIFDKAVDLTGNRDDKTVRLSIYDDNNPSTALATAETTGAFAAKDDQRGQKVVFNLDHAVNLLADRHYQVKLELVGGSGEIAIYGERQALESSWDDPLPYGMYSIDPYDYQNGVYRTDLNFEMYWDDNAEKLQRFKNILNQADYIFITSNRQWGTTVRVPERYPLTTEYYRDLLGCPADKQITWCYSVAQPGMFQSKLGYELVQVFQSDPNIGSFKINDQLAEEAFTVYDHPKVLIFKKTANYNPDQVASLLDQVDLSKVVHLTPRQASNFTGFLELPADRLAQDQAGGTWSELFNVDALYNRYPGLAAVLWYLVVMLLGIVVYPFVRLALGGLKDYGYPFSRLVGLLLLAWFTWLAGSAGIPVTKLTIGLVLLGLSLLNLGLAFLQREQLKEEWRTRKKYFLMVELVFLSFFLIDLFIRLGNPDLWHPYKGGEKPMDFSYFNAILKSTTFPPYDPWYAGGYINYYYYGFVIVGMLVKWLGIVPAIAYNLVLPTLFAMVASGAFCIGWNLFQLRKPDEDGPRDNDSWFDRLKRTPLFGGLLASIAIMVLGNLGTVRMIWQGFQKLAAPDGNLDVGGPITKLGWALTGIGKFFTGANMPYPPGEWYWIPSRVIPNEPITEFPFFTILYADLHAHMIALPVTVLALAWALAIILGQWRWRELAGRMRWLSIGATFFLGGLVIGALRPTNTWDMPTYLALAVLAVGYAAIRYAPPIKVQALSWPDWVGKALQAAIWIGALVAGSFIYYQPFATWYGQGYNSLDLWNGPYTPFNSYFTHWGLFFFVIITWMTWETRDWLASTPVSSLNKLKPHRGKIYTGLFVMLAVTVVLLVKGVAIAWFVIPMGVWSVAMIFRPGQSDAKRILLFMVGTALALTLFVELATLHGDLGRMNTVFKFYFQAWTLLSLSAAVFLGWLLNDMLVKWQGGWKSFWQVVLILLVIGAALYPLAATIDKVTDRMSAVAPHTLDGMAYMATSYYNDNNQNIDLSADYRAIQWMQENVKGSPVIVEQNTVEYRWGSRFTIYTGLPGVVGWNYHQRQQRAVLANNWVPDRVDEVHNFYSTTDMSVVKTFLKKYNVRYIIVGKLEHAYNLDYQLAKFEDFNGALWKSVYRDGDTVIYEVDQNALMK